MKPQFKAVRRLLKVGWVLCLGDIIFNCRYNGLPKNYPLKIQFLDVFG
ncbi:hypothetical protein GCM10011391_40060 [Pullulanibacillus camelliae]|uniref:Uncharacterized protein n=1 Tax=Pullulanibacillus camelliae TaxID=1707096 RepID=A0A8J3E199_9BACL|nr:hypothetical protein [Pullulanibacillus camelliae]GGE57157.1 hypothetical protein GCM10011391_40060 [Pullulanibacillus camelliae]